MDDDFSGCPPAVKGISRTLLLASLFLMMTIGLNAQETILLKGKVLTDSLDRGSVHVVNFSKKTGTATTSSGDFEIAVQVHDTLYFSAVQYELVEVEITEKMVAEAYLEVALEPGINELQEVTVSNINLTGNLKTDLGGIEVFDQDEVGIPWPSRSRMTSIQRKLYSAGSAGGLGNLLNLLTGRTKMLKKARENEKLRFLVEKGMKAIPITVFTNDLAIPEEHVINFVYFCAEEDPDFEALIHKDAPLELIEYYKTKTDYFFKNRMGL